MSKHKQLLSYLESGESATLRTESRESVSTASGALPDWKSTAAALALVLSCVVPSSAAPLLIEEDDDERQFLLQSMDTRLELAGDQTGQAWKWHLRQERSANKSLRGAGLAAEPRLLPMFAEIPSPPNAAWLWGLATVGVVGWTALGMQFIKRRRGCQASVRFTVAAALKEERKRIAQDLHDDLGTRLAEIGLLTAAVRRPATVPEQACQQLKQIAEEVEAMIGALDEIVWAINPDNDPTRSMVSYFCLHAQQWLQEASLRCRLDVARDLPEQPLPPDQRHQLFLAFKEALHNVVRHAGATEVRVSITAPSGRLLIQVEDNGHGLPNGKPPAGADGLKNMRRRLGRLGGSCHIHSTPGRGTMVQLEMPVPAQAELLPVPIPTADSPPRKAFAAGAVGSVPH